MIINLILQRLALGVLTLFVVSLVIFTSVEMLPGDFAQAILGQSATAETLQAYRMNWDWSDLRLAGIWSGWAMPYRGIWAHRLPMASRFPN